VTFEADGAARSVGSLPPCGGELERGVSNELRCLWLTPSLTLPARGDITLTEHNRVVFRTPIATAAGADIRRLWQAGSSERFMDRITESQLDIFCKEYSLTDRPQDAQFEHFAGFATGKRHYDRTFDPADIHLGSGGDTGIDTLAVIVNNVLVTDVDSIEELAEQNGYIEATFIFVQAERSSSFDGMKIANLADGVIDFFRDAPKLVRNERVREMAGISAAIYAKVGMFRHRPALVCYYVTTGKWTDDINLVARRTIAIDEFEAQKLFSSVDFYCFGADEIQRAYNQTRNPISRDFVFANRTDLPSTPGVGQAFLGFIPYSQFKAIVSDTSGKEIWGASLRGTSEIGKNIRT
jgi:hypothetical protein